MGGGTDPLEGFWFVESEVGDVFFSDSSQPTFFPLSFKRKDSGYDIVLPPRTTDLAIGNRWGGRKKKGKMIKTHRSPVTESENYDLVSLSLLCLVHAESNRPGSPRFASGLTMRFGRAPRNSAAQQPEMGSGQNGRPSGELRRTSVAVSVVRMYYGPMVVLRGMGMASHDRLSCGDCWHCTL